VASWANSREEAKAVYRQLLTAARAEGPEQERNMMRYLTLNDLWFLLVYVCDRKDMDRDWLFDRCREVQAAPDGYLDLWGREHYKSTIITFGLTIQNVLSDPELVAGIFSCTRDIAKGFLRQIKREFEENQKLKDLFPDILWANPRHEAPKWNEDDGLILKRKTNPKESTIEAWGLIDHQPTSRHFSLMVYDDVVTEDSTTETLLPKIRKAWELSRALGAEGGRTRYIGTRYHFGDCYATIIDRKSAIPRVYAATDNGLPEGNPVLFSPAYLAEKRRDMGPYVFACQMLQNPVADEAQGFRLDWVEYWNPSMVGDADRVPWEGWNLYLVVDPSGEKKKTSDYSVFEVVGLAPDRNYYTITTVRDRMNLRERADMLISLHRTYNPKAVGYEKYGMQADIEYIKERQDIENYHFQIIPLGGQMPKNDRIRRLVPYFEQHRWFLPLRIPYVDRERRSHDLTHEFVNEEFLAFPVGVHDDMLDCKARILDPDLGATFPKIRPEKHIWPEGLPIGQQDMGMARGHDYDPLEAM
jgi:phage terminase large subunit-like protein